MQLKIEILKALEGARGEDISGEVLATRFGVSRNAVWKAVKSLTAEGYEISAVKNRGYRLSPDNDILSAVAIANAIKHRIKGLSIYVHREIDSTNSEAKRAIADGKEGISLIVAESQTAGRGRQGKSFFSPKGAGLYMTLAFPSRLPLTAAVSVTTAAAVGVYRAVRDETGVETAIKWVNDLYLDGKKVAGILTEAISDFEAGEVRHLIVGVGINLYPCDYPAEIADIATHLNAGKIDRNRLVAAIVDRLLECLSGLESGAHLDTYRRHSMVIGRDITYLRGGITTEARAIDIDEDGWLVVEHKDGTRDVLNSGEITVRTK